MDLNVENPLIQKKIYYPGTKYVPLTEGTRVNIRLFLNLFLQKKTWEREK